MKPKSGSIAPGGSFWRSTKPCGTPSQPLFQDVLGLTRDHATVPLDALRETAGGGEAVSGRLDRYGQRYVIDF